MKKTISIHLMGTNFLVEEDAYELVKNYLERLKNSLGNSNDQKEICEDVELRIAELATAYLTDKKQVVSFDEMKQIIDTLGQPEEFLDEDIQEPQRSDSESHSRKDRRLFRDPDNGMIAGICSGMAAYFKVDVVVFRIIFVLLGFAGGFIIPLYVIMWAVVPKAKTNLERLQMHGRPINLETLKEEFEDAAQRFSKTSRNFEKEITDRNSPTRQRINYLGNAIAKIVGLGLLVLGSVGMVVLFIVGFIDVQAFPFNNSDTQLNYKELSDLVLLNDSNAFYLWLGSFIVGLSGVIFTILLGSVLLFRLKSKWIKRTFIILVITGVAGILICVYQGVRIASDFAISGEYEQKIGDYSGDTLNVKILESLHPNYVSSFRDNDFNGNFFEVKNGKIIGSGINISYLPSDDTSFHIHIEYSAFGRSEKDAVQRSRNITHKCEITGNELTIAPYFQFPKSDKVRNQSITITIRVPEKKAVAFKNVLVTSGEQRSWGNITESGEYEHYE